VRGGNVSSDLPSTERVSARSAGLDLLETAALVELLVDEQRDAVDAVMAQREPIARAVDEIAARLRSGGSLHYAGAGTSGRIAALDAAEMPPTFGTPPELVRAHVAGGAAALVRAIEGAEDDVRAGAEAAVASVRSGDAAIGVSASGGAPFVVALVKRARALGAFTVAITSVADSPLAREAESAIVLATGPEALAGSTRLKAGTAQKVCLNAISTAVMVRLGKVYDNLMVDVVASNAKLRRRAIRLVRDVAGVNEARARELIDAADGRVKVAILMENRGLDAAAARVLLEENAGSLRRLL
jgi:N-acetylmuramic acid 6-phosphate etherase